MPTHTTPPPRAGQTGPEAADPPRRASHFDERGIALQTIIIMVVLLAIAGAVAVVLFNRASEETDRLEGTRSVEVYGITSKTLCTTSGYEWKPSAPTKKTKATDPDGDYEFLEAAGIDPTASDFPGWCNPN